MRFDLKRPCARCPFRADIEAYLSRARVTELERALAVEGQTFSCHETVDYAAIEQVRGDDDSDEGDEQAYNSISHDREQHCAGAMILLEKLDRPNQMMRIMERIRQYDCTTLDPCAPVFDTFAEMRRAQPR